MRACVCAFARVFTRERVQPLAPASPLPTHRCSLLTLPVTLSCLERGTRIHSAVARYAAPVGAVFNKDGAAVYQVIVTAFFARYRGIEDDPIELLAMGSVLTQSTPNIGIHQRSHLVSFNSQ